MMRFCALAEAAKSIKPNAAKEKVRTIRHPLCSACPDNTDYLSQAKRYVRPNLPSSTFPELNESFSRLLECRNYLAKTLGQSASFTGQAGIWVCLPPGSL